MNSQGLVRKLNQLRYYLFLKSYYLYTSFGFMLFINIIIILSLFLDYFRQAVFQAYIDPYIDALLIIIMCCFVLEIFVYIIQEIEYFGSFNFYLDIITTILLVFDIQ